MASGAGRASEAGGARARPPRPVPVALWLGVPPLVLALELVTMVRYPGFHRRWIVGEYGVVETLTVLFLLPAVVLALWLALRADPLRFRWLRPAMLVFACGCAFFAGEELSWGQHWLGFEPPQSIALRNDQGEFNLHNDPVLGVLFDQLPRSALTAAAGMAVVIVCVRGWRRRVRPEEASGAGLAWAWPSYEIVPTAVLAVTATVPEKIVILMGGDAPATLGRGELKEMCLALFLLVYVASIRHKVGGAGTRRGVPDGVGVGP